MAEATIIIFRLKWLVSAPQIYPLFWHFHHAAAHGPKRGSKMVKNPAAKQPKIQQQNDKMQQQSGQKCSSKLVETQQQLYSMCGIFQPQNVAIICNKVWQS
ncbi:hypothetical protein RND71_039753 [Anisodus tanguticus]|uniref:Uncharacterized protein n=1 Tax=Anisodus tanguticus TaxID=243964 RepID=A0AAE1R063_9SOLA|nr:hypothetical protein RND71_039753 [Anisodus tanguticus]